MKRFNLILASALALALVGAPAGAAPNERQSGANGRFKMNIHSHSSDDPNNLGLLFSTDRLAFDFVEGDDFSYSSRVCGGPAPFNDLGLNFRPDYPGVDDDADGTAPVRHHSEGTVSKVHGDRGTIQGTITSVLCVTEGGAQVESEHSIITQYTVRYIRVSENLVQLTGRYRISPSLSTGTFEGLKGHGSFKAVLTCLGNQRDPSQPSCADLRYFADFVGARGDLTLGPGALAPGLVGTYRDSTVQPI
jgi:hypothetical protein